MSDEYILRQRWRVGSMGQQFTGYQVIGERVVDSTHQRWEDAKKRADYLNEAEKLKVN